MGRRGREKVKLINDKNIYLSHILEIYEKLIHRKRSGKFEKEVIT